MPTLAVQINDELKSFVDESIQAGSFFNASELVATALLVLQSDKSKLDALRRDIAVGIQQADRGEFVQFSASDVITEAAERR